MQQLLPLDPSPSLSISLSLAIVAVCWQTQLEKSAKYILLVLFMVCQLTRLLHLFNTNREAARGDEPVEAHLYIKLVFQEWPTEQRVN